MIKSIDEYLLMLKRQLSGCDPVTVQEAISDSEEHLREALSSANEIHSNRSETELLQEVIENYGMPDEIAATYREIEARRESAVSKRAVSLGPIIFLSTLFAIAYFLGQGIILINWDRFDLDGFRGLEEENIFLTWALLCFVLPIALVAFARHVWTSYVKSRKALPKCDFLKSKKALVYLKKYSAPGYGSAHPQVHQGMKLMHETEGLQLDSTYSGKAFRYYLDRINSLMQTDTQPMPKLLFWLTYNSYDLNNVIDSYPWSDPQRKWLDLPEKFWRLFQ